MFLSLADLLAEACLRHTGRRLSERQIGQFCQYGEMLLNWNQRLNLTAITEPQEVMLKHFVDSLLLDPAIEGGRLADIGTGAGFPGIPLKIVRPELSLVLIDAVAKRLTFLQAVVKDLSLTNVEFIHGRAEDVGRQKAYRAGFDTVVSRALARLPVLLEYCMPFVRRGGICLLPKGRKVQEEVQAAQNALALLGGQVCGTEAFDLGEDIGTRFILKIRKVQDTAQEYPRRAGTPEKKPL